MRQRRKKIIVPVSGGKDSLLTLLLAIEMNGVGNCIPLFNDTGWEHPETYSYLKRIEVKLDIKIQTTHGGMYSGTVVTNIEELIIKVGDFPHGPMRFCSGFLKKDAGNNWVKENCSPNIDYEVWYGMRLDESSNRKVKYGKFDSKTIYDYDDVFPGQYSKKYREFIKVKFPILEFTTNQVFDEIRKRGVELNPLYFERTNDRVGCYPCMLASKAKQAKMFNTEFGKIQLAKIRRLEKIIGQKYEMIDAEDAPCGFCLI